MRKILTGFIIALFCLGCVKSTFSETSYLLLKEWIYTEKIKLFVKTNEIILRPSGAEILLLQLNLPQKNHCLYYLVPYKSQQGKLTVIENKKLENCSEINQQSARFEISNLQKMIITFADFTLKLSFDRDGKKEILEFPLGNIKNSPLHQKYKSVKIVSLIPGLELYVQTKHYIGQLSDRFALKHALRCHQVNVKCETVGEYRCNDCRFGWYQVADYNCPQGGSKFCGQNHCGEKNEPACPRGYKLYQNEETGICQSDLLPVYNEDHILVCQ